MIDPRKEEDASSYLLGYGKTHLSGTSIMERFINNRNTCGKFMEYQRMNPAMSQTGKYIRLRLPGMQ